MINQNNRPRDIADLFLQFGGDPGAYMEFKPAVEASRSADPWMLVSALRAGLANTGNAQPEAVSPPDRPVPSADAVPVGLFQIEPVLNVQPRLIRSVRTNQASPVTQRVSVAPVVSMGSVASATSVTRAATGTSSGAAAPTQLDMLFERLAGTVAVPATATGHGLLTQWRLQP